MTPPVASISGGRSRSRRAGRRRLTLLGTVVVVAVLAIAIVLAIPLFRKAVNEIGGLPLSYSDVIRQQAGEKHVDAALVAAVIYAETKYDPSQSSAGAEGLMQILPQTAEFLARRSGATTFHTSDLGTPQVNIAYGTYYLRYLLDEYHGSEMLALAAYNGGETNVDRWIATARQDGRTLTVSAIPFPQTRAYVEKVMSKQQQYRQTYASQLGYG